MPFILLRGAGLLIAFACKQGVGSFPGPRGQMKAELGKLAGALSERQKVELLAFLAWCEETDGANGSLVREEFGWPKQK